MCSVSWGVSVTDSMFPVQISARAVAVTGVSGGVSVTDSMFPVQVSARVARQPL